MRNSYKVILVLYTQNHNIDFLLVTLSSPRLKKFTLAHLLYRSLYVRTKFLRVTGEVLDSHRFHILSEQFVAFWVC